MNRRQRNAIDTGEGYEAAYHAVGAARDAVGEACPNARDYYVQGPDAYGKARAEHASRLQRLQDVQDELLALFRAVAFDISGRRGNEPGEHGKESVRHMAKKSKKARAAAEAAGEAILAQRAAPASMGQRVADQTVCLTLRRGRFGNRRQASLSTVTTDADKALIGLRKTLLVSPELTAIASLDGEATTYLDRIRLQAPYKFTAYTYLLALQTVEEVDAALRGFQVRRGPLVEAAVEAYPTRMRETAERLGSLTAVGDYPTAERFRASFYMEWEYIVMATPVSLHAINGALFQEERAKAAERLEAVAIECQAAMRAGLQQLVDKMVHTLTPGEDGKPRRFHKSVVGHMAEFLRTFEMKNVTDDAALAALAARAQRVLSGLDAALVRSDAVSRATLAASFVEIQTALVPMTARRQIDFDEAA